MRTRSKAAAAAVLGSFFGLTALAETYKDPRQRFELEVPAGWTAAPFGEGVKVARGGSYSLVMDGGAEAPDAVVNRLAGQFGGQWTKFQQLKQGSASLGGRPAPFSFYSGVSPKGVSSFLKVAAVSVKGRTLAIISSAPEKEFLAVKPGLDQIEQGLRFNAPAPARRPLASAGQLSGSTQSVAGLLKRGMLHGKRESVEQWRAITGVFRSQSEQQ